MIYKKKIIKHFLLFSLFALTVSTVLFAFVIVIIQKNENFRSSQNQLRMSEDVFQLSGQYIYSNIENLEQSENLLNWANASDDSSYYFYSIKTKNELAQFKTNFSNLNFDISITTTNPTHFVITPGATLTKNNYFSNRYSVSDWYLALAHFETNNTPYIIPHYEDNILKNILCVYPNFAQYDGVICLIEFSIENIVSKSNGANYAILPSDTTLDAIYSNSDTIDDTLYDTISNIKKDNHYYSTQESYVVESAFNHSLVMSNEYFPFTLVLLQNYTNNYYTEILLIAFFPFALFLFFMLPVIIYFSKSLYQPVSNIITDILHSDDTRQTTTEKQQTKVDEFNIIKENTQNSTLLRHELSVMQTEKENAKKESYFRDLLWGIPERDCPLTADEMNSSYYVLTIEYHSKDQLITENEVEFLFQRNLLHEFLQQDVKADKIFYLIHVENLIDTIILQADLLPLIKNKVEKADSIHGFTLDLYITLSEMQNTVMQIHNAYDNTRKILEYRYILPQNTILTATDIEEDAKNYYYFPLTIENNLITALANGNSHALSIYDRIIRQNNFGKEFSDETLKNFVMALINSISRVFQEIKQTPEEFLGKPFESEKLALSWKDANIWSQIRLAMSELLEAFHSDLQNKNSLHFIMKDFIENHYSEDIMLNDLATYCKLTPTYCSTVFKQNFNGITFKAYLNSHRIKTACNLLTNNPAIKISELGVLVGFNSANSFIRAFNKELGLSPKAYLEKSLDENKNHNFKTNPNT